MFYKQKNQRYKSRTQQDEEPQQQDLSKERKLVLAWQQDNINDSYQSIVLKYLDLLAGRELQQQIQRELQRFYHKSSFYHRVQYLLHERQKTLDLLYQCCQKMNGSVQKKEYLEYDLQEVCNLIDHVRKTSMFVSESVWEMFEYFKFETTKKSKLVEGKYYINIFASFDQDWSFAKDSLLKYYIPFTTKFDPLLIETAKPLKKLYSQNKIVYNQHVDELFRLNASYLYRLLRAHQRILGHYMLTKDLQAIQSKKQMQPEEYSYEKAISHYSSSSRPERKSDQNHKPASLYKDKKVATNRNGSQQKKAIRFSTEEPKASRNVKDNRQIIRTSQIIVNNNYERRNNQQQSMPKKLSSTNQSPREAKSSLRRQMAVDDQTNRKRQKPLSRTEPLDHNMYLSRNIDPKVQQLIEERPKRKPSRLADKKPIIRRKRSKTIHLPKLIKVQKDEHHLHDQTSDCLCRQRYISRLKQSSADVPAEQVEQRRQTIIKKINQKYRMLAKKQIRYELSMMGDATYHRMKDKSGLTQKPKKKS